MTMRATDELREAAAAGGESRPPPDGHVTICDRRGRAWGRGRFRHEHGGTGELVAPLWMVSLGGSVTVRLAGGRRAQLRVREITGMDGPVATVRVEVVDG